MLLGVCAAAAAEETGLEIVSALVVDKVWPAEVLAWALEIRIPGVSAVVKVLEVTLD